MHKSSSAPGVRRERRTPRTPRGHGHAFVVVLAVAGLALAACSSGSSNADAHRHAAKPATAAANGSDSTSTSTTAAPATTTTTAAPTTTAPHVTTTTKAKPAPAPVTGAAASSGAQLITVTASGYGQTVATFDAYQRNTSGGWQLVYGPWQADIGENGFAPAGQKKEGDGRTPSGTYGFTFFFEDLANPGGFKFPFRQATTSDVWDDDPNSADYNQWIDESTQGTAAAGASPEPMYDEPSYNYGAVIAYNMDPVVAGDGSAIFLHVSTGQPTVGCVSLPQDELLEVLRWLDPSQQPLIKMGVG